MKAFIYRSVLKRMIEYGQTQLPYEACGVLLGDVEAAATFVHTFVPVPNISTGPLNHFLMDPLHLLPYIKETSGAPRLAGFYHTHPLAPAIPSEQDLLTEWHTVPTHWIVSYAAPSNPHVRCYRYDSIGRGTVYESVCFSVCEDNRT
ncbi:M67 family metallopeptidase [Paenibacillus thalictri]|nr:M67 family metallopeptidase [Paenibacillus thalictri]